MKDVIEKLESALNQGLYGRDDEVRLALLCTLADKPLFLYGHDDAMEIKARFDALFGENPIKAKVTSSDLIKKKYKINEYAAYCFLGNHTDSNQLYDYLFSIKTDGLTERLKKFSLEAQKVKKYFNDFDYTKFWNDDNKNTTIHFIESLTNHVSLSHTSSEKEEEDKNEKKLKLLVANISDKQFKDFLHLLAINLLISERNTLSPMDFGMFYYCLKDWAEGLKYLEETICMALSSSICPTFVFHNEEYEKQLREEFYLEYEKSGHNLPHSEFMVYVPYSSSPSQPKSDILQKIESFHRKLQQISKLDSNDDIEADIKEAEMKEEILKKAQLEEMELKESQLAQVQLKRSAFKTVKEGLDERLKIATAKETELREQREALESKYKDSKIAGQKEGYESQIAEVKAKESQYTDIRLNLEGQLQDAKNDLENRLKKAKEILESKLKEIQAKEADVKAAKAKLQGKIGDLKSDMQARLKKAKDYLLVLRSSSVSLSKAVEACDKQIKGASKPNPLWANPLKSHTSALRKIQKNLPNMIRILDSQIKQYEEAAKKKLTN